MEPRLRIGAVWGLCAAVSLCAGGARGQQIAKLTADDSTGYEEFGLSVSLSGDAPSRCARTQHRLRRLDASRRRLVRRCHSCGLAV